MPAADVYSALWRHRVLIALLTVLAGVAAYAFSSTQPKVYEASALIRIQQRTANPAEAYGALGSLELGKRLAQTYAAIVQTGSTYNRVAKALDGQVAPNEISIRASPVGDIELLRISARSERPAAAALVANATTVALRQFITETGTLRDQIVVIDRAGIPNTPVAPRPKLTVAIAVLLALMFNCALALALEFFADRLPGIDEWEEKLGRPVLATVPTLHLKSASEVLSPSLKAIEGTASPTSTETLTGPTRWSISTPGVRTRGGE